MKKKRKPIRRKVKPIKIADVVSMLVFDYAIDVYSKKGDKFLGTYGRNYIILDPKNYIYRPAVRK